MRGQCTFRAAAHVIGLLGLAIAPDLAGQTMPPEQVADRFHRSIQLLRWETLASTLHPEALGVVHERATAVIDLDTRGVALRELFAGADRATYDAWSEREVFVRLMTGLSERVQGLINVLATNEYEIVGPVMEGSDRAHVVVRTRPYASGPVPERMQVVSLARHRGEWKVTEADELEAIRTAITAIPSG